MEHLSEARSVPGVRCALKGVGMEQQQVQQDTAAPHDPRQGVGTLRIGNQFWSCTPQPAYQTIAWLQVQGMPHAGSVPAPSHGKY